MCTGDFSTVRLVREIAMRSTGALSDLSQDLRQRGGFVDLVHIAVTAVTSFELHFSHLLRQAQAKLGI